MYRRKKITSLMVLALCAGLLAAVSGTASAAGELDLTAPDSSGWINNAWFVQGLYDNTPSGTGVWLPFLNISAKGNATTEHGYNTDGTLEFDTQDQWTSSLLLDAVEIHEIEGTKYREFMLDANEPGSANTLITLDKLQIFLGNAGDLTGYDTFGGNATKIWDMDATKDWFVTVNAQDLAAGSGRADLSVFIPNDLFVGGEYVYLYSAFSNANAGFEEWAVHDRQGVQAVPEPVTMLGFATPLGLLALGKIRQRFSK